LGLGQNTVKKKPLTAAGNIAGKLQRKAARRTRWAVAITEEGVKDTMHATRKAGEGVRDQVINQAKGVLKAVRKPLRTASRHRRQLKEQQEFNKVEWGVEQELDRLISRGRPIVAGPWLSEVGFEALYWVPFLRWVKTAFHLDPERVVAVSRGGVGSWYAGVAQRYVEIWDLLDPADFARKNAARGVTKHYERSPLDEEILAGVARHIGTADFDVVHPSLMYRLFTLYWSGQRAMGFVDAHARFEPVAAPTLIDPVLLPSEYVAVKFYAARSLPDTPAVREWMRRAVAALAEQAPVVLLDTGLVLEDDHADFDLGMRGRVISAKPWMTPRDNLGIQTQIVAGARAFVGTCGSIAWLAPQLGVDTSALFIDPKWLHAHLPVAMRAYHRMGAGRFSVADLRAVDPLGALAVSPTPGGHL
jgi:hypothetical protein